MKDPHPPIVRSEEIFLERIHTLSAKTDRIFALLFVLQWAAAIITAVLISPLTWTGPVSEVHIHLWSAIFLGGLLTSAPVYLALTRPGRFETRIIISIAQACFSGLLIHLSGGRIETHFHIFGSLAFLAFYRDWRVLLPATLVVASDHLLRGLFWPESVFGILSASPWRAFEHAGWVIFEDVFLVWSCVEGTREIRSASRAQAQLEIVNYAVEKQVAERTSELQTRTQELEHAIQHERAMESQLARSQKLVAAGVAHEINTPMQFVNDNLHFLKDCSDGLFDVLESFRDNLLDTNEKKAWEERQADFLEKVQQYRFERMQKQMPLAIEESLEGVQRVVTIVRAMKEFSHPGTAEKVSTDINEAIRSTATISKNRWKYAADIKLQLTDDLPDVKTLTAELNQVLLNLVVNAGDAIAEKLGENSSEKGTITIRTYVTEDYLMIEIADTGCGIPDEIRERVFDPFFTTKDVGKGTGQGLSISYDVIVNKHQGKLHLQSTPGEGTTFTISLPLMHRTNETETDDQELLVIS